MMSILAADNPPIARKFVVICIRVGLREEEVKRTELTARLKLLGIHRADFAARLGLSIHTTYHWAQVPEYAVSLVEALERIRKLEKDRDGLRGVGG